MSVRFGAIKALSEVSFTVEPGAIHAVIGPNGAGKSTMFNVLSGVYKAAEGQVRFGDAWLDRCARSRSPVSASRGPSRTSRSRAASRWPRTPARPPPPRRRPASRLRPAAPAATREGKRHGERPRSPTSSSSATSCTRRSASSPTATRKWVEVARALCTEPRLLLLDEPVAGMNAEETVRMSEAIREIRSALGTSAVPVEHDMGMVMSLADRVTVLDFGRRIADGTPPRCRPTPRSSAPTRLRARDRSGRGCRSPPLRDSRDAVVTQFPSLLMNGVSLGYSMRSSRSAS